MKAREGVLDLAEDLVDLLLGEDIGVGVDALRVERVDIHEVVADFVGGIAQHYDELVHALGDAFEQHGEAVA